MPAQVVLGAQWGDEGKGKLVDQLAQEADWVARFQGGNNAGHTIVLGEQVLKLHQLPSGLTNPDCQLVLGTGMVVDPWVLEEELDRWKESTGESPEGERLWISERAHVNLPFHRLYDGADQKIGTTGRGIGPTYRDKIERVGVRFCDLKHRRADSDWIAENSSRMTAQLAVCGVEEEISAAALKDSLDWVAERFGSAIKPTGLMLDLALRQGQNILLEGAQGCLLDIDHGTYPFVTSSVTSRANATHGVGIHPGHLGEVYGVVKAYTTRVGHGPFPSELLDDVGAYMGKMGHEFGTTTGRPRRCGWLDLVIMRHAHRLNGFTQLTLTKLDVLGGLDELEVVIGYDLEGQHLSEMPACVEDQARVTCITEKVAGFPHMETSEWLELARKANGEGLGYSALPDGAREYVEKVEAWLGIPITSVGVGPDREATVYKV
ncbi:MAG: adenylosuccinate synthase [Candidatus Thalassarchaeaceae archaeon]|jgi:adenylosuccinate synthase|nr:adenylosuccinate synthase [Candidatus Thalassarchaeaceae archaeon]